MVKMTKETPHWWWFETHRSSRRSPWLQSTLGELDKKTKEMLKLIEADADSFAQRAEMYYKKRPELVCMVKDFYKAHRLLAERYDQLKSDSGHRLIATLGSSFSTKVIPEKLNVMDQNYDSLSESYDHEDCESEVDDPEEGDEMRADHTDAEVEEPEEKEEIDEEIREFEGSSAVCTNEVMKLRAEKERLEMENTIQKDQLLQKDEEKREVIRQLSLAVEVLKRENEKLRKCLARDSPKKRKVFEFENLKEVFLGKLFNVSPKFQGRVLLSI